MHTVVLASLCHAAHLSYFLLWWVLYGKGFAVLRHPCKGKHTEVSKQGEGGLPFQDIPWCTDQQWCTLEFHIHQKPLQTQLHKAWVEGKTGLKCRLRSIFKVPNILFRHWSRPSAISLTFRHAWAGMWGPQGPTPSGKTNNGLSKFFSAQPQKPGCHTQQRFHLLLIFQSQVFLKDTMGDAQSPVEHLKVKTRLNVKSLCLPIPSSSDSLLYPPTLQEKLIFIVACLSLN